MLHEQINVHPVCVFGFYLLAFFSKITVTRAYSNQQSVLHQLSLQFKMKGRSERKVSINPLVGTRLEKVLEWGGLKYQLSALWASLEPLPGGLGAYSLFFLFTTISHQHWVYFKHRPSPKWGEVTLKICRYLWFFFIPLFQLQTMTSFRCSSWVCLSSCGTRLGPD